MTRCFPSMAAFAALALCAASEGGGKKSDPAPDLLNQTDGATPTIESLGAALAAMTKERDEALTAGTEAITELQALLAQAKDYAATFEGKLKATEGELAVARAKCDDLDRRLDEASHARFADLASAVGREVPAAPRIAEGHYVLKTSKVSAPDGSSLARGRVVTASLKRAAKLGDKLRPATVDEVENSRFEIVAV